MYQEDLLKMNPYVLLSIVNIKLRDEFSNLETFAKYTNDYDNSYPILHKKVKVKLINKFFICKDK